MTLAWLKLLHLGAIAVWAAGLICLPFLNRQRYSLNSETELHRLHSMVRYCYVVLVSPAAFVAIGSGTALIFQQQTFTEWFSLKLLLVGLLAGIHVRVGRVILKLFDPAPRLPRWRHAAMMIVTLVVITSIVAVVLIKPPLHWPSMSRQWFAPGALGALFERAQVQVTDAANRSASLARIDHQPDAVIEHQLAAMPTRQSSEHGRQHGQREPMRQYLFRPREAHAPIGTDDGQQGHRRDGMRPTADAIADARHGQQFRRADQRREQAETEREPRAPYASAQEERIAGQPVEHVDAQRSEH